MTNTNKMLCFLLGLSLFTLTLSMAMTLTGWFVFKRRFESLERSQVDLASDVMDTKDRVDFVLEEDITTKLKRAQATYDQAVHILKVYGHPSTPIDFETKGRRSTNDVISEWKARRDAERYQKLNETQ